ncbi:hydroxyisourate hydrolase [Solwaraspora sp. WMMD406]|uniref:hydroxyisourate hydrolase n=1 Tax=Solwaraspora sp. WMMD406 TaxID=3016095 RepID=UPI002416E837|nr:hydroxyisourate hydrolase [Solwaraspora sp. WMMD406]MDG4765972.1 hydroxyisourate hydrolase [Solwaraspora sp. WMMD406]
MDRRLDAFNGLPVERAHEQLLSCCAADGWVRAMVAGRPYPDRAALAAAAEARVRSLPWPEVLDAVAAHPRIGRPPAGDSREARWSRREQAAATGDDAGTTAVTSTSTSTSTTVTVTAAASSAAGPPIAVAATSASAAAAELAALNDAYERRFGYRFLIFANGRGADEIATAARARLHHDDDTEQAIVRTELGRIAALRVGRLVDDLDPGPAGHAALSTHVLDTTTGTPVADLPVRLDRHGSDGWRTVATGRTDADGRLREWAPAGEWDTGAYRLTFDVAGRLGTDGFYTEIPVAFTVHDPDRHHHVPLLLSPYGYTTYRGS